MGELFCHFKMLVRFLPQAALTIAIVTGIHPLTLGSAVAQISQLWFCYLVPKLQAFGSWESILGRWWYILALFPSSFLGICCWTAREWATCTDPITPDAGFRYSALDCKLNSWSIIPNSPLCGCWKSLRVPEHPISVFILAVNLPQCLELFFHACSIVPVWAEKQKGRTVWLAPQPEGFHILPPS